MDDIDLKIIERLMSRGRISWAELGAYLGLSAPAAADRVRRLEEKGVIKGYAATVDPEAMGYGLTAFIAVTLEGPGHRDAFVQKIMELDNIQECHHVTGEDDYLLKVRCARIRDLESLISGHLKSLPGIVKTRTTIVLSTVKETSAVPPVSREMYPTGV